ncbi:hypothetical protein QFZ37_002940 [Chryseobacterium ginsenosidimutans]|uniref:hypothetical protein n=1 Tax=Chryseobacterium ginsenosidimutans TaxID=687846 RepID=UPI00277F03B2|nr:hypothetical protein [Chryseobacterium ginsenosidimutans]MDQ0594571.1 hypothetical protein [Chryseobacterium ginsenosidimutans]
MKVTLKNINTFFQEYPVKNIPCDHKILTDYEKIFEVYDGSFGYLSYLEFRSNDNSAIFLGSYPFNGSDLWKCKKCGKLKFFYTETGGHFPQMIAIDVDFDKNYKSDPFAKLVSINKDQLNDFVEKFNFNELKSPGNIQKFGDMEIIDENVKYVFGFNEYQSKVTFNIIADRETLRKIFEFEKLYH